MKKMAQRTTPLTYDDYNDEEGEDDKDD